MAEKFSLKDHLFNPTSVARLARELKAVEPRFDGAGYVREVLARFPELELKARIAWMSDCLRRYLDPDFRQALGTILRALPEPLDPTLSDDDFGEFIYAPYAQFVADYGCQADLLRTSLEALREITQRFSAEYAIRPFLNGYPEETLERVRAWTRDPNYHVRRLCTEGTRPKLPWAQAVKLPISDSLEILDTLHSDPTRYVTRSVANHLNDLSKVDPDAVLSTLARWRQEGRQTLSELDFLEKHALRTLVKQGHPGALRQLGFRLDLVPEFSPLELEDDRLRPGQALEFRFSLRSPEATRAIVDYEIEFQSKRGRLDSRKIFKLKTIELPAGEQVTVLKKHPLRAAMTTRTLYPGLHRLNVLINGQRLLTADFTLAF